MLAKRNRIYICDSIDQTFLYTKTIPNWHFLSLVSYINYYFQHVIFVLKRVSAVLLTNGTPFLLRWSARLLHLEPGALFFPKIFQRDASVARMAGRPRASGTQFIAPFSLIVYVRINPILLFCFIVLCRTQRYFGDNKGYSATRTILTYNIKTR